MEECLLFLDDIFIPLEKQIRTISIFCDKISEFSRVFTEKKCVLMGGRLIKMPTNLTILESKHPDHVLCEQS